MARAACVVFREDAYLEPIAEVTPRIMLAVGAAWGVSFFLLMLLVDPTHLAALAAFSALGGAAFGVAWGSWFSWYVKRFHRGLIARPQEYWAPQPLVDAERPVLEVLGNHAVGRHHVGGKLVLTEDAVWFLPHNRNGRAFRAPTRIALAEIADLEVRRRGGFEAWLTGERPDLFPGRLRLVTLGGVHEFNVGTRAMIAALVERLTPRLPSARAVEVAVESGSMALAVRD